MRYIVSLIIATTYTSIGQFSESTSTTARETASSQRIPVNQITTGRAYLKDISPPLLDISREQGRVVLHFTGTLQQASVITGPWQDLPNATSPYSPDAPSAKAFYRSVTSSLESIFASTSVVELTITGPLQEHFQLAFAGLPDGIVPPKREKPPFKGSVTLDGKEIAAGLRVRGFSSLQECPFPKLTLKVGKDERKDTPFFDAREIKIGTHCADGGRGSIGRLRDERSTYREALAYEAMETLGFAGPRVRRAQIEFRDTSPTNTAPEGQWTITRHALLFDDPEVIGERMGGHALDDAELAELKNAGFPEQLILDLRFLHILLGNWDYTLSTNGERLWNTDVISFPDGTYLPLAGDFDLCSWVTEEVRESVPWDYRPELPLLERQMRYDLELLQRDAPESQFNAAKQRFEGKRTDLKSLVEHAVVDEPGRTNALYHLDTFFGALGPRGR